MKKRLRENLPISIFHVLAVLMFAVLFCTSLFVTGVNKKGAEEFIFLEPNSFFHMILILGVFFGFMLLINFFYDKVIYRWNRNVLLGIACMTVWLLGIWWVSGSGTFPIADQDMICVCANAMNDGDYSHIWKGGYLARYDHLLGLTTLLRGFFKVFGYDNYVSFQYFNACMLPVLLFSGCHIVRKLSGNNGKAETYYLALGVTCFPMYAYTAFVYGDLSSTAVAMLAVWLFLVCLEKVSVFKLLALGLVSGLAVGLRKNTLIIFLAFGIVILVKLICKWEWHVLLTGCSVLAGILLLAVALRVFYWDVWDAEARPIPALLYVAMGMHEPGGHPGWYDGYWYDLFAQSGDNVEISKAAAKEDIKNSLVRFKSDPQYAWYFYKTKINTQWQAPMYQCIVMNQQIDREQYRLIEMIYQEELPGILVEAYMKAFQVFMYGCILGWLILHWREKPPIENYVLLIAVFGGGLFSILWEAKSRYIMPYLLLMIPCFALGIQELIEMLNRFGKRIKKQM